MILGQTCGLPERRDKAVAVKKDFGTSFHLDKAFCDNPIRFHLFDLYQIGEICCEREYEISPHRQDCEEISFILSGKGVFYIDGQAHPVKLGDVILNKTGQLHTIRSDHTEKLHFAYLGYRFHTDGLAADWCAVRDCLLQIRHPIVPDHEGMALYFPRALREFYDTMLENHLLFEVLIQELLLLTYRDFVRQQAEIPLLDAKESAAEESVYLIMRYIEGHIHTLSGTREIAAHIGYNDAYLSRLFHQKTGMTLQRYISETRIAHAIELMKLGEYSLSTIADMLHYQTPQAFSRAFRRVVGMSAREYASCNFQGYDPELLPKSGANKVMNQFLTSNEDII